MAGKGKRIGFVDCRLDNYHANTYLKLSRGPLARRGFTVAGCTALKQRAGRSWAAANDVPYYASAAELNEHVDCFAILAPSNPELHLDLARAVLPLGKTTFIDKTFAPDARTARRIFALADRHGVAVETSSALRYTNLQDHVRQIGGPGKVRHMSVFASGRSFDEYAIHPLEMVVSCMGAGAQGLMRRGEGRFSQVLINYPGGRSATVNVYCHTKTPYAAAVTTAEETTLVTVDGGRLFANAAAAMLDLFETGRSSIDRKQTLCIMRMLDAAKTPRAAKAFIKL